MPDPRAEPTQPFRDRLIERVRGSRRLHVGAAVFLALAVALLIFAAIFDWNWFRKPLANFASARLQRPVAIDGNLRVRLLSWSPTASVEGLRIGQPAWAPKSRPADMAKIGKVTVSVRFLPLLRGQVELPLVAVEQPDVDLFRDAKARANWEFGDKSKAQQAQPTKLPPINTFIIAGGKLHAEDEERKLVFDGQINARERSTDAYAEGFRLSGKGSLNRNAFLMNVTGGPLLNVRADRPYPFNAEVTAGATKVTAKGQVPKPFDFGLVDAAVIVQGADLANLYDLTGVALPNTPPYRVAGQLSRRGTKYAYNRFLGRVGGSDIGGDLAVDNGSGRPYLTGALRSKTLDFRDLASVFGLPGVSKAAVPAQKAAARGQLAGGRLLPDAPLQVERLRAMDAKVTYRADSVLAPNLPLRAVSVDVKLDKGVLELQPVEFDFPQGRLAGSAQIDARGKTPKSAIDFRVANVRIQDFIPAGKDPKPVEGVLQARIKLAGAGDSVRKAAAAADGAVTAVIPQGQIRKAFAELMGIDAASGLFLLLADDQTPTPLRCMVADFRVRNGLMQATNVVLDTGVVLVKGEGVVNLADERYDLRFKGAPKKLRVARIAAPITVKGTLADPAFGVDAGAAVAQAGIGAALGALLSPIAAILPFVDPGLAKDANCSALFAEARQGPAAVSNAPRVAAAEVRDEKQKAAKKKGS